MDVWCFDHDSGTLCRVNASADLGRLTESYPHCIYFYADLTSEEV